MLQHYLKPQSHHSGQPAHQGWVHPTRHATLRGRKQTQTQNPQPAFERYQRVKDGSLEEKNGTAGYQREWKPGKQKAGDLGRVVLTIRPLMTAASSICCPPKQCRFRARHSNRPWLHNSSKRAPNPPSVGKTRRACWLCSPAHHHTLLPQPSRPDLCSAEREQQCY